MTEQELVQQAKQGDMEAFGTLMTQNERKIFALTLRMTGNREDAEDLAQEAFLNAWRGLASFQGDSSFSTWLYRLASNLCIDHIRKQKRRQEVAETTPLEFDDGDALELPDSRYDPHMQLEQQQLREKIDDGLQQLSSEHREVILLRELSGLSYDEISKELNLDVGTVKSRIARARNSLRKILRE